MNRSIKIDNSQNTIRDKTQRERYDRDGERDTTRRQTQRERYIDQTTRKDKTKTLLLDFTFT